MRISKAEAFALRDAWARALMMVAKDLGYETMSEAKTEHHIVTVLGPIAWGRFKGEPSPNDSKDKAVMAIGYLKGMRDAAMRTARTLGHSRADRLLCKVPSEVEILMRHFHRRDDGE